jgi:hypothetical protein
VSAWPLWQWLGFLNIVVLGTGVVVLPAFVAWYEWRLGRGHSRGYRGRSIPGFLLVELAAVVTLVDALARFGSPPRFRLAGFLWLAIGLAGFVLIVRAWRRSHPL